MIKLLSSLLFAVAVLFNGPTVCAHALTGHGTAEVAMEHGAGMAHGADHAMHGGAHADTDETAPMSDHHDKGGCNNNCEGGAACDGCTVVAGALNDVINLSSGHSPVVLDDMTAQGFFTQSLALEPPPPRLL